VPCPYKPKNSWSKPKGRGCPLLDLVDVPALSFPPRRAGSCHNHHVLCARLWRCSREWWAARGGFRVAFQAVFVQIGHGRLCLLLPRRFCGSSGGQRARCRSTALCVAKNTLHGVHPGRRADLVLTWPLVVCGKILRAWEPRAVRWPRGTWPLPSHPGFLGHQFGTVGFTAGGVWQCRCRSRSTLLDARGKQG